MHSLRGGLANPPHFYQQNLTLLAEVEELEHKSRRRDIVVDDDALFDFMNNELAVRLSHLVILIAGGDRLVKYSLTY